MTSRRILGELRPNVEQLAALGFTGYDAAVLSCLVQLGEGDSSQIAAASGVPRTSVYGAAQRLVARGLALVVATRTGQRWSIPGLEPRARWGRTSRRLVEEQHAAHADRLRRIATLDRLWRSSPAVDNPGDDQRHSL